MYCFSIPPQKDPGFTENFVSLVLIWSSQLPFINFCFNHGHNPSMQMHPHWSSIGIFPLCKTACPPLRGSLRKNIRNSPLCPESRRTQCVKTGELSRSPPQVARIHTERGPQRDKYDPVPHDAMANTT